MDDRPTERVSKPESALATSASYEYKDHERPTDPTLPQNRPDKIEEPSPAERAISMTSEQQESLNKEEGFKDVSQIGYIPLKVSPCANIIDTTPAGTSKNCAQDGTSSCGKCHLVRYCSRGCQLAHWPEHKKDCHSPLRNDTWRPTWDTERRLPSFSGDEGPVLTVFGRLNYLWGNIPAIDILNLSQNEGKDYAEEIALCFAASGDLRNLMVTINGLPATYKDTCTSVLNDKNVNIVARNVVMLLISAQLPPIEAAELILHIWYSARLTQGMLAAIGKYAKMSIADTVAKIKGKSDNTIQSKKWAFGTTEITVRLYKPQWTTLLQILEAKHDVMKTEEERRKVVLAPSRIDYRERQLFTLPDFGRICSTKFRETGVLAPFGLALNDFNSPNPTLFNEHDGTWLQKDSASPDEGWPVPSVLSSPAGLTRFAKHDANGLLYHYIRTVVQNFCQRVQNPHSRIHLILYCLDAAALPATLALTPTLCEHGFDRIEISNIADEVYLGLSGALRTFAPLLKEPKLNTHATLITLFINACELADHDMGNDSGPVVFHTRMDRVRAYLNLAPWQLVCLRSDRETSAELMRLMAANDIARDYDALFEYYMGKVEFEKWARDAGVKMRKKNRVVEMWPMRVNKQPGEKGAREEFERVMASSSSGAERYVEWVRKG